ncbi:MAG: hypothetical protein L0K86_16690 [Actinomycetia bacterium]|nr:hypothetical protein [Actinomycetes bacterium]
MLTAALRNNSEEGLRSAIIELQLRGNPAAEAAWNAFVEAPQCIALAIDLGIRPNQVGEGDFGDVSSNFIGGWSGSITQQNPPFPPYTLTVDIRRGKVGSTIASGRYTGSSQCSVHWVLLSANPSQMVVNEVVDSGTCFNNITVTVRLTADGRLNYNFEDGNGLGSLERT